MICLLRSETVSVLDTEGHGNADAIGTLAFHTGENLRSAIDAIRFMLPNTATGPGQRESQAQNANNTQRAADGTCCCPCGQ